jgi:hypothetical protein
MITHFRFRNLPDTRRGKTGSRAAYSCGSGVPETSTDESPFILFSALIGALPQLGFDPDQLKSRHRLAQVEEILQALLSSALPGSTG